jgi:uncharacterized repeat protein (TIGR03803 family)
MIRRKQFLTAFVLGLLLAPAAWAGPELKVLHSFGAPGDGAVPSGPPLLYNGNVFGVTGGGGTGMCSDYGCGMVYEISPSRDGQWIESAVYDFTNQGGYGTGPVGNLVADPEGDLYGTTVGFGAVIFRLQPGSDGWSISSIYDGGYAPGLTIDRSGNIFGLIGGGIYGAMGELSPFDGGFNYTDLYNFCDPNNCFIGGGHPNPVTMDAEGNLYGTTFDAGAYNAGVAYQLSRSAESAGGTQWTFHLMHTFGVSYTPGDGLRPNGGLTEDSSGNAYGTTSEGGGCGVSPGCGTVFELSPDSSSPGGWRETILYDFPGDANCEQGCAPGYNLVFDKAGNLYGINGGGLTCPGGPPCGMIYRLTPTKSGPWTYSIVHKFNGADGEYPIGLAIDENGNLFGTTKNGGTYNLGTVFEITP